MTRKHFVAIAATIADIENPIKRADKAHTFAAEFAKVNPRFDRARFLTACKVKG